MKFNEYEIKLLLVEIARRIRLLESQPEINYKRIKKLRNAQDDLYKRLEELRNAQDDLYKRLEELRNDKCEIKWKRLHKSYELIV